MRVRTWSACVALAWGILLIVTAAGPIGSDCPAQATTRIASITSNTSVKTTQATLTSSVTTTMTGNRASVPIGARVATASGRPDATAASAAVPRPAARSVARAQTAARAGAVLGAETATRAVASTATYVVQPGDTLSGIAAALGIPGGWPALYAANRRAVGPDPGLIQIGRAHV